MAKTYEPIATATANGSQTSITFSSISGSYTDLMLVFNGADATTAEDFCVRVNGDTGTNYSRTWLTGNGSAASSGRATSASFMKPHQNAYMGTDFAYNYIMQFMNYSNSTTYKSVLCRGNGAPSGVDAIVNLWRNTAAITTILCYTGAATNFANGSTFTLYGIKAA